MFGQIRSLGKALTGLAIGLTLAFGVHGQSRSGKKQSGPPANKSAKTHGTKSAATTLTKFQIDGDRITMFTADGVKDKVRIALSNDGASWWRAIKVIDKNGHSMIVERQEGVPSSTGVIELDRKRLGSEFKIEFWKAKLLGVHTYMASEKYQLNDFVGKTVTFTWYDGMPKNDTTAPKPINSAAINDTQTIDGNKKVTFKTLDNMRDGKMDRGTTKIRMTTGLGVNWWKAIKVFDSRGSKMLIEKQDGKYLTSDVIEVDTSRFSKTVKIELWAAKFLGAHTNMKTVTYDAERLNGRTLTVNFASD